MSNCEFKIKHDTQTKPVSLGGVSGLRRGFNLDLMYLSFEFFFNIQILQDKKQKKKKKTGIFKSL